MLHALGHREVGPDPLDRSKPVFKGFRAGNDADERPRVLRDPEIDEQPLVDEMETDDEDIG
ncbi:MAG: hypothetical protein IPF51_12005 [Dehalococcoidia bacterium]|uniref:hypothetical protein n=1 Tax=Candidatus Amarobacter glycogenicus TaxID=3140699 RepID=UPI003134EC46|nr:hypothetical protein [Dehalococcoidia bacterium]